MTELAINLIDQAEDNIRHELGDLGRLAESIREQGLLQPLLVTPHEGRYLLVAGSRRLAAATQAGLGTVPTLIREMDQRDRLAAMLAENLQRGDLSPIEEAEGYARLLATPPRTSQRKLARLVGTSQPVISKRIALLGLPALTRQAIHDGRLSVRYAEELLPLVDAGMTAEAEAVAFRLADGKLKLTQQQLHRYVRRELLQQGGRRLRRLTERALRQQGALAEEQDAEEAADAAGTLAATEREARLRQQGLKPCPTCKGRGAVPLREDEW